MGQYRANYAEVIASVNTPASGRPELGLTAALALAGSLGKVPSD